MCQKKGTSLFKIPFTCLFLNINGVHTVCLALLGTNKTLDGLISLLMRHPSVSLDAPSYGTKWLIHP